MRKNALLALAAAAVALIMVSPKQASAFGDRPDRPSGWVGVRDVRHWVYYPRYHHFYLTNGSTDPYAYDYEPRGYYPYYNSGYWKPRGAICLKRHHARFPTYYKAWGANKKHYDHVEWHNEHHGGHRRGDW